MLKAIPKVGRWSVVSPRPAPAQDQGELRPSAPKLSTNETRSAARIPTPPMSRYQTTSIESTYRKERGLPTRTRENPCCTYRSQRCSDRSQWSVGGRWSAPRPPPAQGQGEFRPSGPKFPTNQTRSAARIPGPPMSRYQTTSIETTQREERALATRTRENHFSTWLRLAPRRSLLEGIRKYKKVLTFNRLPPRIQILRRTCRPLAFDRFSEFASLT